MTISSDSHQCSTISTFPQEHPKGSGSGPPPDWPTWPKIDEISIRDHRIESFFDSERESDGLRVDGCPFGVDFSRFCCSTSVFSMPIFCRSKFGNGCFGDRVSVVTVVTQVTEKRANTYLYLHWARTPYSAAVWGKTDKLPKRHEMKRRITKLRHETNKHETKRSILDPR